MGVPRISYTGILIFANVVFFIFALLMINNSLLKLSEIALQPGKIVNGESLWTLITSMFMHGGLGHLFVNMVSLMFIGGFVEKLIGYKRFLGLYFASGIFAGIFFVLIAAILGADLNVFAVGASGAIFGIGGLLAVLTPRLPVLVFFVIPMPMWIAMAFLLFGLWAISIGTGLPIGNTAHLGGLLVGLGYGFYLKNKYPNKTRMISRHFSR
jgi:membrane associated rhomboid family serine protease|tara:strand:- start:73 stop:705 length:633 start_codon:yes stop_codon:yes gene_type:complete